MGDLSRFPEIDEFDSTRMRCSDRLESDTQSISSSISHCMSFYICHGKPWCKQFLSHAGDINYLSDLPKNVFLFKKRKRFEKSYPQNKQPKCFNVPMSPLWSFMWLMSQRFHGSLRNFSWLIGGALGPPALSQRWKGGLIISLFPPLLETPRLEMNPIVPKIFLSSHWSIKLGNSLRNTTDTQIVFTTTEYDKIVFSLFTSTSPCGSSCGSGPIGSTARGCTCRAA